MWISKIDIQNVRGFANSNLNLSRNINILIGKNNSGKTTLLKSVLRLQDGKAFNKSDLRHGCKAGSSSLFLEREQSYSGPITAKSIVANLPALSLTYTEINGQRKSTAPLGIFVPTTEPNNPIYPYLSRRKSITYNETINLKTVTSVTGDFQNLYPKVDRLSDPAFQPAHNEYIKACQEILGFRVSAVASTSGKQAAYTIKNLDNIPISAMGEGIPNLLGLIVDLCIAENKIFLIEEPENDLHPQALKCLLELIAQKSSNNQFIITTHSNIVVRQLGAQPESKLFNVEMEFIEKVPSSQVSEVERSTSSRRRILESLGYELFDFGIYEGWLILEESSAEKIIREYLIPFFTPALQGKLRTFSARSLSEVEAKFKDFNNLFVFLHLQPSYLNKAWVVVDGGDCEAEIIGRLQKSYSNGGWNPDQFKQFSEHDFEAYYPKSFQEEIAKTLSVTEKKEKRIAKKALLEKLELWIEGDIEQAKEELNESAQEVIRFLKEIESQLLAAS